MNRGVKVKTLFLNRELLEEENKPIQEQSIETFKEELPKAELKYSKSILPLRGSIVGPSFKYKTGEAIFLVEGREMYLS